MFGIKIQFQLSTSNVKELMLSNYGAEQDFWEFLGQQGDQTSQS